MVEVKHPVAALIDRVFSVIGCAFVGAAFGVVVMIAVYNLTDPPVELGWFRSIASGTAVGAVFGFVFPRVGAAICEIVAYVLPW